jgi:hypothetical protein
MRFNPPPGWPSPPPGWSPPPAWQADPKWPQPPPGWVFWVDDTAPQGSSQVQDSAPHQHAIDSKARLKRLTSWLVLLAGLALFTIGAYLLILHKREANLVASLCTLAGLFISLLQLFITFPVFSLARDPRSSSAAAAPRQATAAAGKPAGPQKPAEPAPASSAQQPQQVPLVYGLAFMAGAILSCMGALWLLKGGSHPTFSDVNNYAIATVASSLVITLGLPGFHALQAAKGGYISLSGCVMSATSSILGGLLTWRLVDQVDKGRFILPPSYHDLAVLSTWASIVAVCLISIAILRAGVYPRWTAAAGLIGVLLSVVWLAGHHGKIETVANGLDGMVGSVTYIVFAWYMVKRQLSLVLPVRP